MATLTLRPYTSEADLPRIVDLLNACEAVDHLDEGISIEELREELTDPRIDPARDIRLWEDADGALVAYAEIWKPTPPPGEEPDGFLWFKVHPDMRGGSLEVQALAWGEARMREVARECGARVTLRSGARDDDTARLALLRRHGFSVVRYFLRMGRRLDEPIPEPEFPAGFTLRHVAGEHEAEAWVAMYNESFIDHWNHHPMTVEVFKHTRVDADYRAEQDLIAVAPDGTFAAFCHCQIHQAENARTGRNEGWVHVLGTRRGFRKIGLGRAMLLAGLHRLKADGVDTAILGVDAMNPTGATRLYESVGFHQRHTFVACSKDVEP